MKGVQKPGPKHNPIAHRKVCVLIKLSHYHNTVLLYQDLSSDVKCVVYLCVALCKSLPLRILFARKPFHLSFYLCTNVDAHQWCISLKGRNEIRVTFFYLAHCSSNYLNKIEFIFFILKFW